MNVQTKARLHTALTAEKDFIRVFSVILCHALTLNTADGQMRLKMKNKRLSKKWRAQRAVVDKFEAFEEGLFTDNTEEINEKLHWAVNEVINMIYADEIPGIKFEEESEVEMKQVD